jgi:hypothetical protein
MRISWRQINTGIENQTVNSLLISNDTIYSGNQGSSLWKRCLSEIIGINNINIQIPRNYLLSQNFPNPFNMTTSFRFKVSKFSNVKICIFDILGNELEILVNEKLKAGTYEILWNANKFASGLYFISFKTDNFSATKKMILLK